MVGLLKPTSQEAEIQSAGNQASDVARFNPSTPPSSLTHSPTVSGYFWDSLKALSALMLPLPSVPALGPLHKAEEHRIGLHFRGPERTSEGQASQRPHP